MLGRIVTYIQNIQFHCKVTKLFVSSFWRKRKINGIEREKIVATVWERPIRLRYFGCLVVCRVSYVLTSGLCIGKVACQPTPTISRKQEHRTTTKLQKEKNKTKFNGTIGMQNTIGYMVRMKYCIVLDRIVFHLKLLAVEAIWLLHRAYFSFVGISCCCSVCLRPLFWCSFSVGSWILEFRCCAICI